MCDSISASVWLMYTINSFKRKKRKRKLGPKDLNQNKKGDKSEPTVLVQCEPTVLVQCEKTYKIQISRTYEPG